MSDKLKTCPFCGGEAKVLSDSGIHGEVFRVFHQCYNSLVKLNRYGFVYRMTIDTGWYDTEEEAVEYWNTRAERTCTIKDTDLPQTSPIPGIPRIKVFEKDGRLLAEGYYAFHVNRQPCIMNDELSPEDCDHCLITDGVADWNMPKSLHVKKIVPDGGWIEVVE